ncbi:FtsX-like permease family protein [Kitasatospora sp. NPDC096147]|uniref:ABC transporter permease n=1 Tax=Kitasatospora sp. NPDC096147 TaxID=3364093 RepID=UPI003814114A
MSRRTTRVLWPVVRAGVARRRVQSLVVALATLLSVASAVVAGALLVAVDAPFDHAFARGHGAHLTVQVDPARASADQLAAAARAMGATETGGPYHSLVLGLTDQEGRRLPALTVVGRPGPGEPGGADGPVDRLELSAGRWATAPGEVVLSRTFAGPGFRLGGVLRTADQASGGSSGTSLTVVGLAFSAGRSADAWLTPGQLDALATPEQPATVQLLHRLPAAGSAEQLASARRSFTSALPEGAVLGAVSWLDTKRAAEQGAAPTVPFLVAFGLLGLVMSVITVAGAVSGAVATGLHRIGILKALGFTPGEVVRAYLAQALVPAGAGVLLGVPLGNLLALPLLSDTEAVYGTVSLAVAWWVDLLVPAAVLLVVSLAALLPALRAGRLPAVEALAVGRTPRGGRGGRAHRLTARLPLPRAVGYGLALPFAHPVRALAMLLAVAFGTLTTVFAVGLTDSIGVVTAAQDPGGQAQVTVFTGAEGGSGGPGTPAPGQRTDSPGADPAAVRAAIEAQPGTAGYYGRSWAEVTVAGVAGASRAVLYEGDSRRGALELIEGHWLDGPGQVVAPSGFLTRTGHRLGDTVRVTHQGRARELRIVGEGFETADDGMHLHASLADFPTARAGSYLVTLADGVSATDYAGQLASVLRPLGGDAIVEAPDGQEGLSVVLTGMAVLLTLLVVGVAGLGVLDAVLLDTHERTRELGIAKALGMSPRQTVALVLSSVGLIGLLGAALGVPAGTALHALVLPAMGRAAGTGLPHAVLDVYHPAQLALLAPAGLLIALLGALLPAVRAARAATAAALRAE